MVKCKIALGGKFVDHLIGIKGRKRQWHSGSAWGNAELQLSVLDAGANGFIDDPESELSCNLAPYGHFPITPSVSC